MSYKFLLEILKYLDCFGTNFNFYTEKNRKFYTTFGGVLTILSIFVSLLVFIFINFDDLLHNVPISTTSTAGEEHRNIKFLEEKIWIPWRIRDYNGKTVDFKDLFYPIAYYYKGIYNNSKKSLDLSYEIINSRLCNETPMANNSNSYIIDIDLDQIYCIDMDELNMGGSFDIDFVNYVEFDLFSCKNGIDYDENNTNCSSYEKIIEAGGNDNSFEFEMYYPVVHYQPMNKSIPIFVKYVNYFYHLSRFSNKIDRIYLQQHILKDDTGWIIKKEKNYSLWGYASLSGDSYATGNKKDLMNEGSSSRFYSFNIYLSSDVVYHNRSYKKLYLILADGLPFINVIFIIFKLITKVFKISSGNKKLTELLFENLQERPNRKVFSILESNKKKNLSEIKIDTPNNNNKSNTANNNINEASSIQLNLQNEPRKRIIFSGKNKRTDSINSKDEKIQSIENLKLNSQNNSNKKIILNKSFKNDFNINYGNIDVNNNNINININSNNIRDFQFNKNEISLSPKYSKSKIKQKFSSEDKLNFTNNLINIKGKTQYVKKKLFPYKYYLCSIFIKNINISKKPIFFTRKFIAVYNFICQLFDISSYLILQREFQILKSTLMIGKYRAVLEKRQKINVNDHSFNIDMKECLDSQKFSILGRIKSDNNFD